MWLNGVDYWERFLVNNFSIHVVSTVLFLWLEYLDVKKKEKLQLQELYDIQECVYILSNDESMFESNVGV